MSLQAILDAITVACDAEVRQIQAEGQARAQELLAAADGEAEVRRAQAREAAARPAIQECARIQQRAQLEAWRIQGQARDDLIDEALEQVRDHLSALRTSPGYPSVVRHLLREALAELTACLGEGEGARVRADPRDARALAASTAPPELNTPAVFDLRTWGGVVATSADGRIAVDNTLEARFERSLPSLRRHLATAFDGLSGDLEGQGQLVLDYRRDPALAGAKG